MSTADFNLIKEEKSNQCKHGLNASAAVSGWIQIRSPVQSTYLSSQWRATWNGRKHGKAEKLNTLIPSVRRWRRCVHAGVARALTRIAQSRKKTRKPTHTQYLYTNRPVAVISDMFSASHRFPSAARHSSPGMFAAIFVPFFRSSLPSDLAGARWLFSSIFA